MSVVHLPARSRRSGTGGSSPAPRRPRPPALPRVRVAPLLVAMVLALGALEVVWLGLIVGAGLAALDPGIVGWWVAARPPGVVLAAVVVTTVGGPAPMIVLLVVVVAVQSIRRHSWRPAVLGAVGLATLSVVDIGVKAVVARPRPPAPWHVVAVQGWSFPSGHAMFAAGVLFLVVWLASSAGRSWWLVTVVVGVLFTVLVGASRVILGVHYPSDVVAGWCLAILTDSALLLVVALVRQRGPEGR